MRIDADLALGRHAGLVAELDALAAEDTPFASACAAHLMLALYRSGRQAEALAAYQTARSALVDELGMRAERGRCRRSSGAILRQDRALEWRRRRLRSARSGRMARRGGLGAAARGRGAAGPEGTARGDRRPAAR